jgi:5-methyltetrahydropteroyltriglutamate--homocysteine methyltransferase
MTELPLFPTQIVGSWRKPKWLANHDLVYAPEGSWWRVAPEQRAEALDDATRLAIYDQNQAGLTFITDGEQRRQTFSGYFYVLGGIDSEHRAEMVFGAHDLGDSITMKPRQAPADGPPPPKPTQPRVVAPITWTRPILLDDLEFLKRYARGLTKMTVIGPCSLALRVADEFYGSLDKVAFAIAEALNHELRALAAAGVDLIQLDEPEAHFRYSQVKDFAVEAINRTIHGVTTRTAVHVCYGYSKNIAAKRVNPVYEQALALLAATNIDEISLEYEQPGHAPELLTQAGDKAVILGLLNLDTEAPVETIERIVARAREALTVVPRERLRLASDCGMWFLPRDRAFNKIKALEAAARVLRDEA